MRYSPDPENTLIQMIASGNARQREVVGVVAYENEFRFPPHGSVGRFELHADCERAFQDSEQGFGKRYPFAAAIFLQGFPFTHDGRVEPDARIVDEHMPV